MVPIASHLDRHLYPFLLVYLLPIVTVPTTLLLLSSLPVVDVQDGQGEAVSHCGRPHRCGSICISTSDALLHHSIRKLLVVLRISLRRPIQIITACAAHDHALRRLDLARCWDIPLDEPQGCMSLWFT